jgi:predicted alpha/beta superfamily hydrolase
MRARLWHLGLLSLLCLLWAGCPSPLPPSESQREKSTTEFHLHDTRFDGGVEPSTEPKQEPVSEPTPDLVEKPTLEPSLEPVQDSASPDNEPSAEHDEGPTDKADAGNEVIPETSPELSPDSPPVTPLKASAVSLRASFLGNSLQTGLMERDKSGVSWIWEGVVSKGNHTLALALNNNSRLLYALPTGWQGRVQQQTTQRLTLTQDVRLRVEFSLKTRRLAIHREAAPLAVRLRGHWNGKSGQSMALTPQNNGIFVWSGIWKKGIVSWHLETGTGAKLNHFTIKTAPHAPTQVGGSLKLGKTTHRHTLLNDTRVRLEVDILHRRWRLLKVVPEASQAWKTLLTLLQKSMSPAQKTKEIQSFLARYRMLRQLPIVQGTSVTFVLFKKPTKGAFFVSGSFNNWDKSAQMKQIAGTELYHATLKLANNTHHEYKFRDAADQWTLDPNNPRYLYAGFGPNSVLNLGDSGKSHLESFEKIGATQLKNTRTIRVYVPPGFQRGRRYPVLYMHDGQNLFNPKALWGGWGVQGWADTLIAQKKMRPFLIVGLDNTPGRMSEYTHTTDKISGNLTGGKAKQYADFLWRDVKPWLDATYPTRPGFRSTGVMGSSLGGLISFWLGWTGERQAFRVGALSSTFIWGKIGSTNATMLDLVKQGGFANMVVYLDSGSPRDNSRETLQMRDLLKSRGYLFGLNLQHHLETGAAHNEAAWKARLFRPLQFLCSW